MFVLELLFHGLLAGLIALDGLFRPSLGRAVPDRERLETDPAALLASGNTVTVGPRWWFVVSALIGPPLGAIVAVPLWLAVLVAMESAGLKRPDLAETLFRPFLIGGAVLGWPMCVWLSRGGRMTLREDGVSFEYRGKVVFCPWNVIRAGKASVEKVDEKWYRLAVRSARVGGVTLTVGDRGKSTGAAVSTSFAGFDHPGLVSLARGSETPPPTAMNVRDLYAVRAKELLPFLVRVAERITPPTGGFGAP